MAKRQRETTHIVEPFRELLEARGWVTSNITPGALTDCVPDSFACHPTYGERWIEYKVKRGNTVHLTDLQMKRFPLLIANGMRIFCIAAEDLRGRSNYGLRKKLYAKLFTEPNGKYMLHSSLHKFLF